MIKKKVGKWSMSPGNVIAADARHNKEPDWVPVQFFDRKESAENNHLEV
jgi:hypothetical protein